MPFVALLVEIAFYLDVEQLQVNIKCSDTYAENKLASKC